MQNSKNTKCAIFYRIEDSYSFVIALYDDTPLDFLFENEDPGYVRVDVEEVCVCYLNYSQWLRVLLDFKEF